jgi:hypothetical protein
VGFPDPSSTNPLNLVTDRGQGGKVPFYKSVQELRSWLFSWGY